ncbi:MAG: FecR domain-containing protein [Microscillaceae bacterium]|jgi:ferric-dicitrate binding protein FerR (iron transport regulator)|nr:FecR domain-containing protein [Microscillaceae bacterium]
MENYNKNYLTFTVEDFATDESFQQWVFAANSEAEAFWEEWLRQNPQKLPLIEEAKTMLLTLGFSQTFVATERIQKVKLAIDQYIQNQPTTVQVRTPKTNRSIASKSRYYYGIAASVVGILALSFLIFYVLQKPTSLVYQTDFGETKEIVLPDGSQVVLNPHSKITYQLTQQARQVWLDGDALFKVNKVLNNSKSGTYQPFIVYAKHLKVKVLGTEFNVKSSQRQTDVVLHSGKVELYLNDAPQKPHYVMKPGEQAIYTSQQAQLKLNRLETEKLDAWKQNKLIFDELTLQEIAAIIQEKYGLEMVFEDPTLAQKKFVGAVPNDKVEMLFTTLTKLYGIEIEKKGKQVILKSWREE